MSFLIHRTSRTLIHPATSTIISNINAASIISRMDLRVSYSTLPSPTGSMSTASSQKNAEHVILASNQPLTNYIGFSNIKIQEGNADLSKYLKDVRYLPIFEYPEEILNLEGLSKWKKYYRKGKFILKYYFYGIKNLLIYIKDSKIKQWFNKNRKANGGNISQQTNELVKQIEYKFMELGHAKTKNSAETPTVNPSLLSMEQLSLLDSEVLQNLSRRTFEQKSLHYLNNDLIRFVWFSGIVLLFEEISVLIFLFLIPNRFKHKVMPHNCTIPELLKLQADTSLQSFHRDTLQGFRIDYTKGDYISPYKFQNKYSSGEDAGKENKTTDPNVLQISEHYMKYIFVDDLLILRDMWAASHVADGETVNWYKEELVQKCCERFLIKGLDAAQLDTAFLQERLTAYLADKYGADLDINKKYGIWNVYTLGRISSEYPCK